MALHGWVGAEDEILNAYASACLKASEDDEFFSKFKKVDEYRPIIEGGPKLLFDTYLGHIREHNFENTFLENLEKFRINDSIGDPDLYIDSEIGKFSPTTLKFAHNTIDILEFIKDHGDVNNIKNIDAVKNDRFVTLEYVEATPGPRNINAVKTLINAFKEN